MDASIADGICFAKEMLPKGGNHHRPADLKNSQGQMQRKFRRTGDCLEFNGEDLLCVTQKQEFISLTAIIG